ncbi:PIG-L family deacetylase [Antrihabitans cavernicola]|uniref:PIG-L family deacetylase n=1 Tax=Antrihabitans cavernicola TaxID=2495913 RepID=UPI0016599E5F|nr:PIG-L family deacetylase [Spelaeibacter cavernicola]
MIVDGPGPLYILSPHLDDAVLAVGALIGRRTAARRSVHVISVYSDGPPPTTLRGRRRVFGDYGVRRGEDDRALALLGADRSRMGLRERLFRNPPLARPIQVFRTPSSVAGFGELDTIESGIREVLADPVVTMLAPLGIGNHVDHVEVSVAAMRAAIGTDATDRIAFYEEFYAISERCRRRHPVSATAPFPWPSAPGWSAPRAGLAIEAVSWAARGPASSDFLGLSPTDGDHHTWTAQVVPVGGHEQAKIAAIGQYRSQTAMLGGLNRLAAMIRRSHARRGGELLWHLVPPR